MRKRTPEPQRFTMDKDPAMSHTQLNAEQIEAAWERVDAWTEQEIQDRHLELQRRFPALSGYINSSMEDLDEEAGNAGAYLLMVACEAFREKWPADGAITQELLVKHHEACIRSLEEMGEDDDSEESSVDAGSEPVLMEFLVSSLLDEGDCECGEDGEEDCDEHGDDEEECESSMDDESRTQIFIAMTTVVECLHEVAQG